MRTIQPSRLSSAAFITDHLPLASYLITRGHEPVLATTASGKVLFQFPPNEGLEAAVEAFNSGLATVEPTAYDAARIQLRRNMDALNGGAR